MTRKIPKTKIQKPRRKRPRRRKSREEHQEIEKGKGQEVRCTLDFADGLLRWAACAVASRMWSVATFFSVQRLPLTQKVCFGGLSQGRDWLRSTAQQHGLWKHECMSMLLSLLPPTITIPFQILYILILFPRLAHHHPAGQACCCWAAQVVHSIGPRQCAVETPQQGCCAAAFLLFAKEPS